MVAGCDRGGEHWAERWWVNGRLTGPPAELVKFGQGHPLDGSECAGFKAMNAIFEGLAERPRLRRDGEIVKSQYGASGEIRGVSSFFLLFTE